MTEENGHKNGNGHVELGGELAVKLSQLLDSNAAKPVTFTPLELLKLIVMNQNMSATEFGRTLFRDGPGSTCVKESLRKDRPVRISHALAAQMAKVCVKSPYNHSLFWKQSECNLYSIDELPDIDFSLIAESPVKWQQTVSTSYGVHVDYKSSQR